VGIHVKKVVIPQAWILEDQLREALHLQIRGTSVTGGGEEMIPLRKLVDQSFARARGFHGVLRASFIMRCVMQSQSPRRILCRAL